MADIVWTVAVLPVALGYGLGSIPFGLILTRLTGAGDLRAIGSGNIGATNVLRTGRKGLAAATLLLDMLKGVVAVMIGQRFGQDYAALAGLAAFLGHIYPVWLKFRGGKGVATMLGVTLALHWGVGVIFALVWLGALLVTRISSVGGMAAALSAPIAAALMALPGLVYALLMMALIVIWKHQENIRRLLEGTEPKVGRSRT